MPPRSGAVRERDVDFSAVGKLGRRTGTTLEQRPLDENGLEEISHIFSSPRKPSPLKHSISAFDDEQEHGLIQTPKQSLSIRKSLRGSAVLPRSASPRKSGINGTAKRINVVNLNSVKNNSVTFDPDNDENVYLLSPSRANQAARRISPSPERSPLRDITIVNNTTTPSSIKPALPKVQAGTSPSTEEPEVIQNQFDVQDKSPVALLPTMFNEYAPVIDEDVDHADPEENHGEESEGALTDQDDAVASTVEMGPQFDDEEGDQTFDPTEEFKISSLEKAKANSRKKRKSDVFEEDVEIQVSSPVAKKARRESEKQDKLATFAKSSRVVEKTVTKPSPKSRGRPPKSRGNAQELTTRQEEEISDYVEKVRQRPGPPKSLYLLRRETPADDGATHTRSGRVSVKPLAYWRNERMVYGGSPSANLTDGARFPLNSIREIIRTEEVRKIASGQGKKKSQKGRAKSKPRSTSRDFESTDSEIEEQEGSDPHAEEWETEVGTLRGPVSVWDPQLQAPIDQEEEVDIAYAPAAIQFRENKTSSGRDGPTFSYAKLLSSKFLGVGIVEIPPEGMKSTKNSRKMHMSFFVVTGRVTVTVSPVDGEQTGSLNRFSIGKGGFWQVPRGNDYSILNEMDKTARIFFSQGCEPAPVEDE